MEELFARGIRSFADSHREFFLFQTNWFRRNQNKLIPRCAVLFTLLLVHYFTSDLLFLLLALLVVSCAWLWLELHSQKDDRSQPNGAPPTTKKRKTKQAGNFLNRIAPYLTALEQKLMSASLMDDTLSVPIGRTCYTAISILLLVCFIPTPLFLAILTAFSYASLNQPDEQATTLEDFFLLCIARSISTLHASTDVVIKQLDNFETVKHIAVVNAILLTANLIPTSLFAVCLAAMACNLLSQLKDEPISMTELTYACNLIPILLTVHCIPTVLLIFVLPIFAQTVFQKIKEHQQRDSSPSLAP